MNFFLSFRLGDCCRNSADNYAEWLKFVDFSCVVVQRKLEHVIKFIVFLRSSAPGEVDVLKCSIGQRGTVKCGLD